MNQILVTEVEKKQKKKRNRNTTASIEIAKIVRFFAIFIIIFGLCLIGHSSYALYRDSKANNTNNLAEINITRINDTLRVDVQSTYIIEKFRYSWSNSEERSIPENATSFQEEIILPPENSVLTIIVEDETGRAVTYTKDIILDGIDIAKPSVSIDQQATSIRIKAEDETKIDYMTYRIDDGEEIRIDKNNVDDKSIEYAITQDEIGRGTHKITVTAYDTSGNSTVQESPDIVISTERPEIKNLYVDQEQGKLMIEVEDADGIQSIEVNLNGQVYSMNDVNRTEATFSLNLVEGNNTFSIKVENVNGLSVSGSMEYKYAK
jgi:hypothetical protein